jgi:hypothetical protein
MIHTPLYDSQNEKEKKERKKEKRPRNLPVEMAKDDSGPGT